MRLTAQPRQSGERLVGALVPAPTGDLLRPSPAPMPALPTAGLPVGVEGRALVVETARVDRSGRIAAVAVVRVLGWGPGQRVTIAVVHDAVVVTAAVTGLSRIDSRCQVSLPAAARRMCAILPGPPVVLVAVPSQAVLVIHAVAALAGLLAEWYTSLVGAL
jgi:bifunctional DNA-binding transcriptional regulator/antitoxin component of YhaV-PrlF toxin-antitoxin module